MLSEEQELLLTAFVDGDVTREERESIECLLRNSSEARTALRTMQENAHRLKKLSKLHLGQRFTSQVLASLPAQPNGVSGHDTINITDDGDEPLVRKPKLRRGMPSWVVGAIAASLILAVIGIGAWLLRDRGPDRNLLPTGRMPTMAQKPPKPAALPQPTENPMDPVIEQIFQNASRGFADPQSEPVKAPKALAPEPTKFAFSDLKHSNHYDYLKWELKRQESVRLDVNVRNDGRTLNRLIETFHKHGIHLAVTQRADASFKQNLPVLVYAENVGADKLALVLKELSEDYKSGTKVVPTTYERLQMTNGTPEDVAKVARGLGLSLEQIKQRPETPASPDHAEGVVFGQQPETILPREVHEFLGARRAALPGTLQVFVQLVPKS
jgi:hypothetical protein